jgi:hypothetical protein
VSSIAVAVSLGSGAPNYLNFLSANDDPNVMRDRVGRETYEKLARIKAKYDPTNFFRLNQNIAPG